MQLLCMSPKSIHFTPASSHSWIDLMDRHILIWIWVTTAWWTVGHCEYSGLGVPPVKDRYIDVDFGTHTKKNLELWDLFPAFILGRQKWKLTLLRNCCVEFRDSGASSPKVLTACQTHFCLGDSLSHKIWPTINWKYSNIFWPALLEDITS